MSLRHSRPNPPLRCIMRICLAVCFISSLLAAEAPGPAELPKTFVAVVDATPSATFVRCHGHPDIVAVYSEKDPQWWGRLFVYQRKGDAMEWQYAYPDEYEEFRGHYVVRFRWIPLQQTEKPVLEVIESTHMGNGSLRLWELDGRSLRLLLECPVRGRFWNAPAAFGVPLDGEARFEGDHLGVDYQRPTGQAFHSVHLSGSVQITDVDGATLPSRRYDQIYRWDPTKRTFAASPPTSP